MGESARKCIPVLPCLGAHTRTHTHVLADKHTQECTSLDVPQSKKQPIVNEFEGIAPHILSLVARGLDMASVGSDVRAGVSALSCVEKWCTLGLDLGALHQAGVLDRMLSGVCEGAFIFGKTLDCDSLLVPLVTLCAPFCLLPWKLYSFAFISGLCVVVRGEVVHFGSRSRRAAPGGSALPHAHR